MCCMFLEKRKQGKNIKYFLVHSFREDKEVVKIRRYLGQNLSKTELGKKSKKAESYIQEQLKHYKQIRNPLAHALSDDELKQIENLQDKYPIKIKHLNEKDWLRFSELFAYNTNAIEGSTITLRELTNLVEVGEVPDKPEGDIAEAKNVVEAVNYIRNTKTHFSLSLIKKLHLICFKDSKSFAGKFRSKGVEVIIRTASGEIIHQGAPSSQVDSLLKELVKWYNKYKAKYPPILLATVVHNEFERIHPFQDGNGRVGRLILNNILIKHKLPPVNIEYVNRVQYYATLRASDQGDIRPTIELILKEYKKLNKDLR